MNSISISGAAFLMACSTSVNGPLSILDDSNSLLGQSPGSIPNHLVSKYECDIENIEQDCVLSLKNKRNVIVYDKEIVGVFVKNTELPGDFFQSNYEHIANSLRAKSFSCSAELKSCINQEKQVEVRFDYSFRGVLVFGIFKNDYF